ncbi:MAG: Bcr/CflA family drug resistance efflux transporter [Flavobacterium sp. MedPE-SWcel]|uniref:multidrug effflux MFS transporter n=1 Tax=uncultured Flavobacterium sp. TaxID=165435 RepID=UPI000921C6E9|nr:multidrug effflux MFS transporter [uncultured Flavobacterium sp.]OIQ18091.1 MAG: Bcr/CflA family drug resistance efflux transporter [Flavobacterium sp. MedPE-SWcel]
MTKKKRSQFEFIALMASLMSTVALSIDALLPALGVMENALSITNPKNSQLLITMIFLGLGIGQLISGPLSDSFGRKPVTYCGFGLFVIASFICTATNSLEIMIIGRLLQGVGLSAPRTISIAIVRDRFKGDYMAKIMSFVTVIFIIVPAIAPSLGKFLLDVWGWKSIFYTQIVIVIIVALWFYARQKETLKPENKIPFSFKLIKNGFKEFFSYKQTVVNTIVSGFVTGSFMVFLSTSQNIFGKQYGMEEEFPYIFAAIALTVGFSTLINGVLVLKFGMKKLINTFSILFTLVSLAYIILFYQEPNPSIYVLISFFIMQFLNIGFLFGNLSARAMEPVGHIAGVGSALNGFVATVIAVPIATIIGSFVDTTVLPLFIGFFIAGTISIILLRFIK